MTTFTKFVAVAVAAVSLMAAAPAFACSGTLTQAEVEGLRNEIDLSLSGRDLYVSFVQHGYSNRAIARIAGACNAAVILQRGDRNDLYARVTGTDLGVAVFADDTDVNVDSRGGAVGITVYNDDTRVDVHNRGNNTIMVTSSN